MSRVSFITCAAWVPKGVACPNPEKVEVSKEDLQRIITETQSKLRNIDEKSKDDSETHEEAAEVENGAVSIVEKEPDNAVTSIDEDEPENEAASIDEEEPENDVEMQEVEEESEAQDGDVDKLYDLNSYDDERDTNAENLQELLELGKMTLYASSKEDPLIERDDDENSEQDNHQILPSDNLVAVGHLDGDSAVLEIYVYNETEVSLYVHHDNLLPAAPLCMEWLNYDPTDENLKPGNMLAVGTMSPQVELWDLDMIDAMEPACRLGQPASKKKKRKQIGHKDAVLALSWNHTFEHVLASGSADETVILWDLQEGSIAQHLRCFKEKVQAVSWHPSEGHNLLTGACDQTVRLIDCRDESPKEWKLDGEVERAVWDKLSPRNFLASTDSGSVYYMDIRAAQPLWQHRAHTAACTGVCQSSSCPGCLITASEDQTFKVWDTSSGKLEFVEELHPDVGMIQCVFASPDQPFVFCLGGDKVDGPFKIWDIRQSEKVRKTFCPRLGLPIDEDGETVKQIVKSHPSTESKQANGHPEKQWIPRKDRFNKRKGGHLDKRRKHK